MIDNENVILSKLLHLVMLKLLSVDHFCLSHP